MRYWDSSYDSSYIVRKKEYVSQEDLATPRKECEKKNLEIWAEPTLGRLIWMNIRIEYPVYRNGLRLELLCSCTKACDREAKN